MTLGIPLINTPIQTSPNSFYFSWIDKSTTVNDTFSFSIIIDGNIINVVQAQTTFINLNGFTPGSHTIAVEANDVSCNTSGPSAPLSFTAKVPSYNGRYDIIIAATTIELTHIINEKIQLGWQPIGGTSYIINSRPSYNYNNMYMQTIYLPST